MPITFNIKLISDPVCPQCYIAKKRLGRAMELYRKVIPGGKDDIFRISWHAYYLANNKSSPAEAMIRRFGGSSSTAQVMQTRLQAKGQIDGIKFSFGNRIGSSRDAHRLIYLAGQPDAPRQQQHQEGPLSSDGNTLQDKVVEGLFKRYFEENGDITCHEMLVDVAHKAGLDGSQVEQWLISGEGGDAVDGEAEEAVTKYGITGVPVIIINETVRIDGAQDVEEFFAQFVKIRDGLAGAVQG
ncbi:DSBA-like thioredoxin domain containing protein [Naviculisporaceae sp. PSN 640]